MPGVTPLDVLLGNMRSAYAEQKRLEGLLDRAKGKPKAEIVRLHHECDRLRQLSVAFAKEAAPYMHAKLQAVAYIPEAPATRTVTVYKLSPAALKQVEDLVN